jgi:8-oxo-dGTP diphosphatase
MPSLYKSAWILIKDRKVLYLRSRGKDLFFNPGGKREMNETDEEALIREIKEELSVDLLPETIKHIETFTAQAAGKPEGVLVESKCYEAKHTGELVASNEIEELSWFTSQDMDRTSAVGKLILKYLKENDLID